MSFDEKATHYEILELFPDATLRDIQAAYHRAKTAYTRDSVALYTLVTQEEREETIRRIEEAYAVLSNPARRAEYDRCHGIWGAGDAQKVVSIDRVPPMHMESSDKTEDLLVAPSTDFSPQTLGPPAPVDTAPAFSEAPTFATPGSAVGSSHLDPQFKPSPPPPPALLEEQIAQEIDWHGSLIRRVRETKGISIEEMAGITKISKSNILAIEDENYGKFPAPVYLRGFVMQIAKVLKLPHEKVAAAYLARYNQSRPAPKA